MSVDNAMIYRRTAGGVREVREKSHRFTQSERLILILLDGRLDVAGVKARLPSMTDERLARALNKLLADGLIEATGTGVTIGGGRLPTGALQPEAVAQFLEQTELDPVTIASAIDGPFGAQPAPSAQHFPPTPGEVLERPTSMPPAEREKGASGKRFSASGRTPSMRKDDAETEPTYATDFAITTVNVPDRLDVQEVRAREQADEQAARRLLPDASRVVVWLKWGVLAGIVAVLGSAVLAALMPVRDAFSPPRLAQRLTAAAGAPVAVARTEWRLAPLPRLVIQGLVLPDGVRVDEVVLQADWRRWADASSDRRLFWVEAVAPELALTSRQAFALLALLPGLSSRLPSPIVALHVQSLRIEGSTLLPGRYEATARRGEGGLFGAVQLRDPAASGAMVVTVRPAVGESGNAGVEFRLAGSGWRAPIGPDVEWSEFTADGWAEPNLLIVRNFLANGFYGGIQGTAAAAADLEWVTTASVRGSNLDLESIQQSLRKALLPNSPAAPDSQTVMQGAASMVLVGSGRGATIEEALAASQLRGPVQVRWGVLNGINLGHAATQGAAGGSGVTRFSELEAQLIATRDGVTLREIFGRAGAMAARGQFTVGRDLSLRGALRVELGTTRVQAPLDLRIGGSAIAPRFGG